MLGLDSVMGGGGGKGGGGRGGVGYNPQKRDRFHDVFLLEGVLNDFIHCPVSIV